MKYKKLLSLGLAVLLGTTMPTAVYASEDIVVEVESDDFDESEDIVTEAEHDGEEIVQQEILNEDDTVDWAIEDNSDEIDSASDMYSDFTSEATVTEDVGEEVTPVFSGFNNVSTVSSGNSRAEITRGADAILTLNVACMAKVDGKVIDIRSYDNLLIYADVYIGDVKVNDTSIVLDKTSKIQAKTTYTLTDAVMKQYPDASEVTVKVYSSLETPANAKLDKSFKLITPVAENPKVEEIKAGGYEFKYERGKECSGNISVKLSDRPVEGKVPYYAVYINGERKTEPVALDKAKYGSDIENKYEKSDIVIDPGLTEYLPEGTKIEIKVGFGSEMEDVSDKVVTIEVTGKAFLQGAKVDEVSVYKDASYEKGLNWVRAGRTYTAYVTGKFRDVVETDPLDVYAGVYVSGNLVGELQKMTVEADNSTFNGTITFTLPDDTPSNPMVGDAVRVKVGIGSEMDNGLSEAIPSGSKLDPNEIKVTDLKILDGYQEDEVKYIDRQNPQNFSVFMKLEGLPDDLIGTHHEEWLGDQMIGRGLGSPEGMSVFIGEEKAKLIKDYEGASLTLKIVAERDEEAIFTYEMPIVGLTTKEEETAGTVVDQLKNLPAADKITLEDKESVKAARDAYDALNEDQKKLVPEEQVKALTEAETKIAELQKAADKKAADEKAAKAVTDKIASIPAVKNLKLTDASKVKVARDAYNKLSADQKKLVTAAQLKVLTDAEARITQLQKAAQVKPKITLNVTSLPIQVKKSTTGVRIKTTAIKGDKIKSAKSSNKKVVKVSVKSGKLTIKGLKAGKATITVTSAKGAKATVKITVQKKKVATKKLKATVSTKQTLKKGKKVTLKVAKTPFTAQDTVKWTSSNKKVATVTSKGVVKGLKKGTATITAKAGKKVVKFKVTVK